MQKKKKIEVKEKEDIDRLEEVEREKWEIALELGIFDKVVKQGWRSLTAYESGKIGGIMAARHKKKTEDKV